VLILGLRDAIVKKINMTKIRYDEKVEHENNLAKIRVNDCYMSVNEVCLEADIAPGQYSQLQNGMTSPLYLSGAKKDTIKPWVNKVLDVLGCTFDEAFPRYVCDLKRSILSDDQCLQFLISNYTLSENKENTENKDLVNYLMDSLTEQQKTVIYLMFFEENTLEEIGEYLSLTKERIRQIKSIALGILRKAAKYKSVNHGY
jgi:RNA polymerase sigma factor (sigma-70 family)